MKVYRISGKRYYRYEDLHAQYPELTRGCRTRDQFIKKHSLKKDRYTYARFKNDVWIPSLGKSCRVDKFFIRKQQVDTRMLGSIDRADLRPDLITLSDEDSFFDSDGNVLHVEVVGERDVDQCFFKLKDVAQVFGMTNLVATVTNEQRDGYQEIIHYRRFSYTVIACKDNSVRVTKTDFYLTYLGVLRAIITTRSRPAESFVSWATKTLFTAQMGTKKDREILGSKIMRLDLNAIKQLGKATSGCISCVYLFELGTVEALRDTMDIPEEHPDTSIVYKFGRTKDLLKRTTNHAKMYGKLDGVNLTLVYYGYIDPDHASKAETAVNHSMQGMNLSFPYKNHKELIIASTKQLKHVREQYDMVTELYRGRVKHITDELERNKYEIAIAKQDAEIWRKEAEMCRKDAEIERQNAEILRLKLKLAKSRK